MWSTNTLPVKDTVQAIPAVNSKKITQMKILIIKKSLLLLVICSTAIIPIVRKGSTFANQAEISFYNKEKMSLNINDNKIHELLKFIFLLRKESQMIQLFAGFKNL